LKQQCSNTFAEIVCFVKATFSKHCSIYSNFKDAIDFVGWFSYLSHKKLGIPLNDTYRLYLAYHEGWGGYAARSYRHKHWLIGVARRVQEQANRYHDQLVHCWRTLQDNSWF
ncbi:unnamed protein product, partial [marine sediment metagenome]